MAAEAPEEIEPRPHASEEDENEEVGRPEGPREHSQVDPYGWAGSVPGTNHVPIASARPTHVEAHAEMPETQETDDGDVSHFEEDVPKSDAADQEFTTRPVFGRRPGRSRR
jgi:hypothetical protein